MSGELTPLVTTLHALELLARLAAACAVGARAMPDATVRRDIGRLREPHAAALHAAHVRLLARVGAPVALEARRLRKPHAATCHVAHVWLLTSVHSHVTGEVTRLREAFAAARHAACERPEACVCSPVLEDAVRLPK